MRRKSNCKNRFLLLALSIMLIFSVLIIGLSIFKEQPVDVATNTLWNEINGDSVSVLPSKELLLAEINTKNIQIDSLEKQLKKYKKTNIHKKALVNVDSGTLNMRDKPQLASSIIARIPDSSFVDVLYFDTEFFYLNGKRGRWCKIKYADTVGWVWDDFIRIQK